MITEATVQRTRFHPECLPDARVVSIGAGSEASPPILDLRRYSPKILYLSDVSVEQNANVELRARGDGKQYKVSCTGLPDRKAGKWFLTAAESLYYNLYASANVTNFRTTYNIWVIRPTVAHKVAMGASLSQDEERIAKELNIQESVAKGVLPLPISYMVEREYQVVDEVSRVFAVDLTAGQTTSFSVTATRGEFIVLTEIASSPGLVGDNITIRIDRDIDVDYIVLTAYAMSLTDGIPCFVPALSELKFKVTADQNVAGYVMRYTVRRCRITDLLRARFGLPARAGVPASLFDKVKGGIL